MLSLSLLASACSSSDDIDSDEQARRAYLGMDGAIGKSLQLGFDGFNSAHSANISPQMMPGDSAGTLTITGQVDQGSSANKGMRLSVAMVAYDDGPFVIDDEHHTIEVIYDADAAAPPALTLELKGIPTGTLTGALHGLYHLSGDLDSDVTLDLSFAGNLADGGNGTTIRAPGTTHVTGTATVDNGDGLYMVDVML